MLNIYLYYKHYGNFLDTGKLIMFTAAYGNTEAINLKTLSELTSVSPTTLRSWEAFFEINVPRNEKNSRVYPPEAVNKFLRIKELVAEGHNLKTAKSYLNQHTEGYRNIEILQEKEEPPSDFELILKPFKAQLAEYKEEIIDLKKENRQLIAETAKLQERTNNQIKTLSERDLSIQEQKERIKELESMLFSRKWWQIWS